MRLILVIVCLSNFFGGNASPFSDDVEDAAGKDEYLQAMPYTREQIKEAKIKLNLTLNDTDEYLSAPELIRKYGYPVEEHFVTTKDGYILRMHRIPPTKKGVVPCNRTVFLMHALLMSSADWVLLGPSKAFGYHLADLGYDVWMGNARGNSQSKNHTRWSVKSAKFWKFSWHEIGTIDLPTMIDYVLKETNQKALYHVGHSQGTTTFYVMCSELPQFNKKIIAHYSLAPIAFMKHAYSPLLKFAAKFLFEEELLMKLFGINQMFPRSSLITMVGNLFCSEDDLTEFLCKDSLFLTAGFDRSEFNVSFFPIFMGHTPAGASVRQFIHYAQLINSGEFRKYDYFPFNALHYGPLHPIHPPSYNLKKVTAPVYLYYSQNDWLSSEEDVITLCRQLGNCKDQVLVSNHLFNHVDYMLAIHAKEVVYEVVSKDMAKHVPGKEQLGGYIDIEHEDDDGEEAY